MRRWRQEICAAAYLIAVATLVAVMPASSQAQSAIIEAVVKRDDVALRQALASGADLELRDTQGRTALMIATHQNNIPAAAALIGAGASINAKDSIQDTPFLYAAAEGRLQILELCLAHGANLNDTNRYGGTGLIPAAHRGHVEIVRRLLRTKIDIDHVNNLGWTALLEAVILGDGGPNHQQIVRDLVAAGAKPIADRDGVTPLEHARQRGFDAMVAILEGKP